mmetsp:Transcript_61247/g.171277  ORF Transcript_61247/g.171277 Transcript_61247/m.171277 type:complete len:254 (-) Transcript_61247:89-850(-)
MGRPLDDEELSAAGQKFLIRQLKSGQTGREVFPSARKLLSILEAFQDWKGVTVLELGAGTGAVAVGLALLGARVFATDCDAAALKNIRFNAHRNNVLGRVQVVRWDWSEEVPEQIPFANIDCCVGSDLAYGTSSIPLSRAIVAVKAAAPGAAIILALQERQALAVKSLEDLCKAAGLAVHRSPLPWAFHDAGEDEGDDEDDIDITAPGTLSLFEVLRGDGASPTLQRLAETARPSSKASDALVEQGSAMLAVT